MIPRQARTTATASRPSHAIEIDIHDSACGGPVRGPLPVMRDDVILGAMRKSEPFAICDLRQRSEFSSSVADRVWRAWWEPKGYDLEAIEALVRHNLDADAIPFALVAYDDAGFIGTASVIASDLGIRPQYTPWLAAVWVDPAHRHRGVGSALVQTGAEKVLGLGYDHAHLCALPPKHAFYLRRGWRLIEADVTESGLAVFRLP